MKINNLVLFCKTYNGDFERFKILKESIDKFNQDNIPFYVVCPKKDIELFLSIKNNNEKYDYVVVSDEKILSMDTDHEQNWYTQQIIKFNFYKLNVCEHYLILDSDCYFIKNFYIKDFLLNNKIPYMTFTEPSKGHDSWFTQVMGYFKDGEEEKINIKAKEFIGREGKRFALQLPCIFSKAVLEDMEENFLKKKNLTYNDLIKIHPFEFEWYGDYLIKYKPIQYEVCSPFFVSFYSHTFYQICRYLGFTEEIFAKYWFGLIMHEGWVKDLKYQNSIIGTFIRKIILVNYSWHKEKISKKKEKVSLRKKIKYFRRKYIKGPIKILFTKNDY